MSNDTQNYYEGMFVTKGGGGEDAWDQSRSAVKDVLEEYDAEIDYVENWADQQFEKEIEKQRRGKYVLTYFQVDPSEIKNIKADTQMNERILRVLILNREKETTYRDMIQERIEAKKEEEEAEAEEEEEEEGEEEDVELDEDSSEDDDSVDAEGESATESDEEQEDEVEPAEEQAEPTEKEDEDELEEDTDLEEDEEVEEELAKSEATEASIDES